MLEYVKIGNAQAIHAKGNIVAPWSNFSGVKDNFGNSKRNFTFIIDDPAQAAELSANGWNVKQQANVEPGEQPEYYLKIYVQYHDEPQRKKYDPKLHLVNNGKIADLNEQTVGLLDSLTFESVDIIFTPYNYDVGGKVGISAYLNEGYFVQTKPLFSGYDMMAVPEVGPDEIPFSN